YLPAAAAAQLLVAGSAVWLMFFWLRPVYFACGWIKTWTMISALSGALTLVNFLFLIPFFGYIGLSVCQLARQLFEHAVKYLYFVKKRRAVEPLREYRHARVDDRV
ncbi:MAG: hypothetical protein ACRESL_22930, partial [Pseudomonas sp.]